MLNFGCQESGSGWNGGRPAELAAPGGGCAAAASGRWRGASIAMRPMSQPDLRTILCAVLCAPACDPQEGDGAAGPATASVSASDADGASDEPDAVPAQPDADPELRASSGSLYDPNLWLDACESQDPAI